MRLLRPMIPVLTLLVCLALCAGCPRLFGRREGLGKPADFALTTYGGERRTLESFYGQPLVLNFWAAWCGPCCAEFPEFQQAYNARPGQFTLLSVAVDSELDPRGFVAKTGYSWTFASPDGDVLGLYGIEGIPMTLFISREGRVVSKKVGSMDLATFEAELAKIL
jgi:cytochrome c biogenesis protein CcmG, thiol:disulfide interchange protein DsbE